MSTTLPHGIIQINEGNISWYGDITANWQLIDSKIGIYDAAIASIPAPANNGTLTINYGGTTIAMFGADDAGNVTADIPAPGDGTITVTYGGSTLGTFTTNQAAAETIDIPAPGDGTLTIQKNGATVGTFSANQATNETINITVPDVNDATLTIQKNGTTVDTFTANSSTDKTVNITVPTKTSDLTNDSDFVQSSDLATVATSGNYNDLSNKPTIPTVNNATLTIQKNGSTVGTFSANQATDETVNIEVPSKTSDLTNDSGFITGVSWNDVADKPSFATVATSGSYTDLSDKPTIPTVNNATLTIQQNGTTVKTFTANASSNVTANITVPTKTSELTNDSHVPITTSTDTTSTASPAHSGTFTCIDSVTRDSNGHVTKVNTKTVTLPSDSNTDTLVTQNVSTANENHPILLSATKDATTNQGAKTSIFASGVKVNPSTNTITATTFSGALSGNASSATQFSANKSVTLTGDVTGTASSKAGWSVATTLADSGVTAGTYGPSADVTGNNNTTISVPQITVDAKGRVTSVVNKTLTCKNNTYTVNNKTLTIQKNGSNVATFTANSGSNVTANITVPTKTSDLTNDSGFLTLESLGANSIPFHNAYPRCKYLGTSITDAQNTAIKNRTYDDLFIGDYWTINGVNWRIVAIDYYYNIGDPNFNKGNVIVMPDTILYNAQMNGTNTTAGAYGGSLMRTQNLNSARTIAGNSFGSHLANHRIMLANSVDTSGPNSWAYYDSDGVELPNEVQIYGTRVWGSALKGSDVTTQKQQFPLMALAPQFVNTRQTYWLQDISSYAVSSAFALASGDGLAGTYGASNSCGVRPAVTLSYI